MPKVPRTPSPELLESLRPEVRTIPAGSVVWRIYFRGGLHPTGWKDFRYVGPVDARFDHHEESEPGRQVRAVLYAAEHPTTCLAEVFQKTRVVNRWHNDPWLAGFETGNRVDLLDLTGSFPTRAGASMGLMTGPRSVSRAWARAFRDTYPELGGLYYPSSMHANRPAMVFTERAAETGAVPEHPSLHRSLADPAMLSVLRNAARDLGYALL